MPDRTINPRYVPQTVTVPANTPVASPTSTTTNLGHCILDAVSVFIPSGHQGLTGLAIQLAGVHVVPYGDNNAYVLGDDSTDEFQLGVEVDQGLNVITYNTDQAFSHTFYLRFKCRDIPQSQASTPATVTPITAAPSLAV